MSPAAALLLAIFAAAPSTAGEATAADIWTAHEVAAMAASHAPAARLLESERRAVACGVDREDPAVCAQVALIQSVYGSLADHQANEAAAEAETAYWGAVALSRQLELLDQAAPLLDSLESLAATAERLELPDGDRGALAMQRLELEDRWFEADFARRRLRNQLAGLTGVSAWRAQAATLSDSLPPVGDADWDADWDAEQQIAIAMAQRSDLRALETLCRCITSRTLPAVRDLMGVLSPGIGLAARAAPPGARLLALHAPQPSVADLACRQSQCRELVEARREQIGFEVRDAVLQVEAAAARADVARRRVAMAREAADRAGRATDLEQQAPGSETTAELEILEQQSALVETQLAFAQALVKLRQTQGIAAAPSVRP